MTRDRSAKKSGKRSTKKSGPNKAKSSAGSKSSSSAKGAPKERTGGKRRRPASSAHKSSAPNTRGSSGRPQFGRGNPQRPEPEYREESVKPELAQKLIDETKQRLAEWSAASEDLARTPYIPPARPEDELDPWQQKAFDALMEGQNVIVDAPTTAGKTRVIEAFFSSNIDNPGFRACYTCPVKSLSNDKVKEFRALFGEDKVGIATGDIKENLNAPIVVATLETYRNSLLGVEPDLGREIVIFDEYHYLMDVGRGSAWEEAMILTPMSCQLLLLSASIANAADFVSWIDNLQKRKCVFIEVEKRPVPLTDLVHYGESWVVPDNIPQSAIDHHKNDRPAKAVPYKTLAPRVAKLIELGLTPTILYAGKRLSCKLLAQEITNVLEPLDMDASRKIGESLAKSHETNRSLSFIPPHYRQMLQTYGVAYHHSGLAPAARVAIENLLKDGLLRFCTATTGLSLGINFSVRAALVSDFARPGEGGITKYASSEMLQMLGRAGRRGKDVIGYSLWPNLASYVKMSNPKREDCNSRLKNDPTTFLGLTSRNYSLSDIEAFYKKSFLKYQRSKVDQTLVNRYRIERRLKTKDIPCQSPAHEFVLRWHKQKSLCDSCNFRKECHNFIKAKCQGELAALHMHLHSLKTLDNEDKLSSYGEVARFFPHAGGLMVAKMIDDGEIAEGNLLKATQLFAALSMARFKTPGTSESYNFPYNPKITETDLEEYYPISLFEELYDPPFGRRNYPVIRDFNPKAGYIISEWMKGLSWPDLLSRVTTEAFGAGDVTGLLYRTASYLQSISQACNSPLGRAASAMRDEILREPLDFSL